MSKKRKNYQKTKQQKLEQQQALAYRESKRQKRNKVIKGVLVGVLCLLLVLAFCFPSLSILLR